MKVYLATDHAGFALKETIKIFLQEKGYDVEDCGPFAFDKNDDYPDWIEKAAQAVSKDPASRAIIFGHSGQGEAIVANKFLNVRAVVFYCPYADEIHHDEFEIIRLTREHNDANILSIGAHFLPEESAKQAVSLWLETQFTQEERHTRRIEKIRRIEEHV